MEDLGAEITAIAGQLAEAMEAADRPIDGALVDVQLGREQSLPLIEKLSEAGIPFILMTGYDPSVLPATLAAYPRLAKPSPSALLEKMARDIFARE